MGLGARPLRVRRHESGRDAVFLFCPHLPSVYDALGWEKRTHLARAARWTAAMASHDGFGSCGGAPCVCSRLKTSNRRRALGTSLLGRSLTVAAQPIGINFSTFKSRTPCLLPAWSPCGCYNTTGTEVVVIQYCGSVFLAFICVTRMAAAGGVPAPVPPTVLSPAIVIGFLGGRVAHNNAAHSDFQLARRLRQDYPKGVDVILYENRRSRQAHHRTSSTAGCESLLGATLKEKLGARIAIYGHSWETSETVTLARALGKEGIPVLLTVQVNSIRKPGENDESIPANVAQAVNFYQRHGLLPRPVPYLRRRRFPHANPGQFSIRLPEQCRQPRRISLVRAGVYEISYRGLNPTPVCGAKWSR